VYMVDNLLHKILRIRRSPEFRWSRLHDVIRLLSGVKELFAYMCTLNECLASLSCIARAGADLLRSQPCCLANRECPRWSGCRSLDNIDNERHGCWSCGHGKTNQVTDQDRYPRAS